MSPKLMENTFNVDLFGLVWIAVAVVVVGLLASHFYRGLEERTPVRRHRQMASRQHVWLTGTLTIWWTADTLWHARAYVVTRLFWRPEVRAALHQGMPWLAWTTHLWSHNPVLWDFMVLTIDGLLAFSLFMTFRHPPVWLKWGAVGWGLVRWGLAGADAAFPTAHPFGPGAYLMAAAAAYLMIAPAHYRHVLAGIAGWLALDSLFAARAPFAPTEAMLLTGFGALAWASYRGWTPLTFRLLAVTLAVQTTILGVGGHALHLGLNLLWTPILAALAIGRDFASTQGD